MLSNKYPLLSTRQVARRLGLSQDHVARLRLAKPYLGPPFIKLGRSIRYSSGGLDDWIEAKMIQQAADRG